MENVQLWRSKVAFTVEVPGPSEVRSVEVRVRPSHWIFRFVEMLTAGATGDSDLIFLHYQQRTAPIKRTSSGYDRDIALDRVRTMLASGDVDGLANHYNSPKIRRLLGS